MNFQTFENASVMTKGASPTSSQDLERLTSLFRLLSDKTRLTIVMLLSHGERNVSSLCTELGLPQPTVSHHLGLLRTNNVVSSRRDGKQVFYALSGQETRDGAEGGFPLQFMASRFSVTVADPAE